MSGTIKGVLIAGFAINTLGCANQDLPSISQILPHPKSAADTTFNAAQAQEKLGRVAEARRAYQKLYDEDPENADVCHRLAIVCAKMGDARLSHRHFLEAIRLAPDNAQIIADYGYAKLLDRDLASAETLLRKAISMQPGNKRARNNLALVRKRRKHRDQIGKTQSQRLAAKSGKTAKKTAPPKKRLAQTTPRTKTLTQSARPPERETPDAKHQQAAAWPASAHRHAAIPKTARKNSPPTKPKERPTAAGPRLVESHATKTPRRRLLPPIPPLEPKKSMPQQRLAAAAPFPTHTSTKSALAKKTQPADIPHRVNRVPNAPPPGGGIRQTSLVTEKRDRWTATQPKSPPKTKPTVARPSVRPAFVEDAAEPAATRPDWVKDTEELSPSIPIIRDPRPIEQKPARVHLTPLKAPSRPWRIRIRPATRR